MEGVEIGKATLENKLAFVIQLYMHNTSAQETPLQRNLHTQVRWKGPCSAIF